MSDYAKMTVATLRAELGKRGLSKPAKKNEMIKMLEDDDTSPGSKSVVTNKTENEVEESKEDVVEDQETAEPPEEASKPNEDGKNDIDKTAKDEKCADNPNVEKTDTPEDENEENMDETEANVTEETAVEGNDKPPPTENVKEESQTAIQEDDDEQIEMTEDGKAATAEGEAYDEGDMEYEGGQEGEEKEEGYYDEEYDEAMEADDYHEDGEFEEDEGGVDYGDEEMFEEDMDKIAEELIKEKKANQNAKSTEDKSLENMFEETFGGETKQKPTESVKTEDSSSKDIKKEDVVKEQVPEQKENETTKAEDQATDTKGKAEVEAPKMDKEDVTNDQKTAEESGQKLEKKDAKGEVHIDSVGEVDEDFTISLAMLEADGDEKEGEEEVEEGQHGIRDEEEYEERPLKPIKLRNALITAYIKGKKKCALYVDKVKKSKMLTDVMRELAQTSMQYLHRIYSHGAGYAFFEFLHEQDCNKAKARLLELMGEKAEIFNEIERPAPVLVARAREDFPLHFTEARHLMVKDYPEEASFDTLVEMFPNAIFVTRVHKAAEGLEKKWFYRPPIGTTQKFVPPPNYKTLVMVEFCSSKEAKTAGEAHKEGTVNEKKFSIESVPNYLDWYGDEYGNIHKRLALERVYKDDDRLEMLKALSAKRGDFNEMKLNRRWLDGEDELKFRGLGKEISDLAKAIQIDTLIRCKVGMDVPETERQMTRHTLLLVERGRIQSKHAAEKKEKSKDGVEGDKKSDEGAEGSRKRTYSSTSRDTSRTRDEKKIRLSDSRSPSHLRRERSREIRGGAHRSRLGDVYVDDRRFDSPRGGYVRGRGRGRGNFRGRGSFEKTRQSALDNLQRTEQQLEIQRRMLEKCERMVEDQKRATYQRPDEYSPRGRGRGMTRRPRGSLRGARGSTRGTFRGSSRGASSRGSSRGGGRGSFRSRDEFYRPDDRHDYHEERFHDDRYRKEERYRKDDYRSESLHSRRDSGRDYYSEDTRSHHSSVAHSYDRDARGAREGHSGGAPGGGYKRYNEDRERAPKREERTYRDEDRNSRGHSSRSDAYDNSRPYTKRMKPEGGKVGGPAGNQASANVASVLKGLTQVIHSKMDEMVRKAPSRSYATKSTDLSRPKSSLPRAAMPGRHSRTEGSYTYQR